MFRRFHLKKISSLLLVLLFCIELVTPFFYLNIAAAAETKRLYIDFPNNKLSESVLDPYYSASNSYTLSADIASKISGAVTGWSLTINGKGVANCSSNCNQVSTNIAGEAQTVYGRSTTNPGHRIFRLANGTWWEHKGPNPPGLTAPIFQFNTGGVSDSPGYIPPQGYLRDPDTGATASLPTIYNASASSLGNDLRYKPSFPPPGLADRDPAADKEGWASTRSYDAPSATEFYVTKDDAVNENRENLISEWNPATVVITGAEPLKSSVQPFAWDTINGKHHVAVRRLLNTACSGDPSDCTTSELGETAADKSMLANYVMEVATKWEAQTYVFSGYVDVNYSPPTKPDLTVAALTGASCIAVGTAATYSFSIKNAGSATTAAFQVKITADGTEIKSFTYANGIGTDETQKGTFEYMASSAGIKSFTVWADSENAVDEAYETNNTRIVAFEVKASCAPTTDKEIPSGPCTGDCTSTLIVELTVREPVIEWKDRNIFDVKIKNPKGSTCTPVEGRFAIEQGKKEYQYPYRPVTGMTDDIAFAWLGTKYPGDMETGNVKVYYALKDSCGKTAYADPKKFEIVKTAGAPKVSLSWYDASTNAEVMEVVQGTRVYLKPKITDSRNERVTRLWDFTSGTSWVAGLPAAQKWTSPLTAAQYENITAAEKGTHKVCVAGTNESGVSDTGCATLYVIGPDPVAVIDVGGWLKEGRRIELSGERSSSPRNSPLTYAWSIEPVAGKTQGTLADLSHNRPATGKTLDIKTTQKGHYQLKLIVTDAEGLTGEAVTIIEVAPDVNPVATITGNSTATRQPADKGLATFTLIGAAVSLDQDIIAKRLWSFRYDANNDGVFDEPATVEIDEASLVVGWEYPYMAGGESVTIVNTGNHTLQVKGAHVGRIQTQLRVLEIPGQPTDLRGYTGPEIAPMEAKKDQTTFQKEVINENPDVTFKVTGVATEPMPMNVVSYTPSVLKTWANTSLDSASIANGWGVSQEGSLISPRRKLTDTNFSFPSSNNATFVAKIEQGNMPSCADRGYMYAGTCRSWNVPSSMSYTYIGNNKFIGVGDKSAGNVGYGNYFYLMGTDMIGKAFPLFPDFQVPFGGGFSYYPNMTWAINEFTDEFMVYSIIPESNSYSGGSGGDYYATNTERHQVYRLSDLRKGQITYIRGGTFFEQYHARLSSSDVTRTGIKADWSDGTHVKSGAYLPFDKDYKKINLTARTISSYRYQEAKPYQVESYTAIPAMPRYSQLGYCDKEKYAEFCSASGNDEYAKDLLTDNYGNYYHFASDKLADVTSAIKSGSMYKFDRETGMPSVMWSDSAGTYWDHNKTVTPDGQYIKLYRPYSCQRDYGEGCTPIAESQLYIQLATGTVTTWIPPAAMETFASLTPKYDFDLKSHVAGQSGWGVVDAGLGDVKAAFQKNRDSLPGVIYDETTLTDKKTGSIWTFTPETEQTPVTNEYYTYGQLINPNSQQIGNGAVSWSMKTKRLDYLNMSAGVAFRIQDHKNMLRLEAYKNKLALVKIINGRKSTIKEVTRIANSEWASYKIKLSGTHIKVYVNNGLVLDAEDATFTAGTMGPYSTTDSVEFKGLNYQWSEADASFDTPGTAIVDTAVTYEKTYADPENDPMFEAGTQWKHEQLTDQRAAQLGASEKLISATKFLDVGDGKSGIVAPYTVNGPTSMFGKVGLYKLDYRAPDDPHPDHRLVNGDKRFDSYSKYSDWYTQYLIVHRKPFSIFTLAQAWNGIVQWLDTSYDPDRCYAAGNCQAGISENGIKGAKFYYITPEGVKVDGKLTRPTQSGLYTVAMAVKDEYSAWSDWYEQTLDVTITTTPNNPPSVVLMFPTGTNESPTFVGLQPTITWTQNDIDPDTVFTAFNLRILTESGECYECVNNQLMNTPNTEWSWTMERPLELGKKYSVQVQSSDGESWSAWSEIGWMITNRPPTVVMVNPNGSQRAPTIYTELRPKMTYVQTDPDPGTIFNYVQLQIVNAAGTTVLQDTGRMWQGTANNEATWTTPTDFAVGEVMGVRAQVIDNAGAVSEWSPYTWFLIVPEAKKPRVGTDTDFDQRMNPDNDPVFVLGRPIVFKFDTTYEFSKELVFPFDVYNQDQTVYYPKNNWIPVTTNRVIFQLPVWEEESAVAVDARQCMWGVCKTDRIPATITGRMYEFRVWDVGDFRYETVFRTEEDGFTHTANQYVSGGRDQNGGLTNMFGQNNWILPIRPGSHPDQIATVPHNGYPILFDFKTIGNYWDKGEGIRIDPTFWFVPRSGGDAIEVDLYYDTTGPNKMIRVGSDVDQGIYTRTMKLADPYRNIENSELEAAAVYEYQNILTADQRAQQPWNRFWDTYLSRDVKMSRGYSTTILSYKARTFAGPTVVPAGVDPVVAQRSIQHWYGEYSIPIAPYVLPKGTDLLALYEKYGGSLDTHEPEFLTDGYITVNLGLYTVRNGDENTRILGYKAPRCDMWAVEGQIAADSDWEGNRFNFRSGDVVMFESDFSVRNDYTTTER